MSIPFAFGAMIFWGIGDFLIQKTTRKAGDVAALTFIGIIGSIVLFPFITKDLVNLSNHAPLLILLGILTFAISIINFEALKRGKLSVVEVMLQIELPVTVLLAIFLFQEVISPLQTVLLAVIFFGLISLSSEKFTMKHLEKGVILALIAGVGSGFINVFTAYNAQLTSPLLTIWVAWVV